MDKKEFLQFIERTSDFHAKVASCIGRFTPIPDTKFIVAFQSGHLAFEHSTAALQLISNGLLPSGFSLFRPQFESLLRGVWLLYAASDAWIDKFNQPLTVDTASKANEGPMPSEMLAKLEKSEAPAQLVTQLKQYKDITWKALSSYTHGGIHPISRTATGYPIKLTYDALRNSNAITALTAQLMAILTGDSENMIPIRKLHIEFVDCLPIISDSENIQHTA